MIHLRPLPARATDGQRDALRATLLEAAGLPIYAERFTAARLTQAAIQADPISSLRRLPLFRSEMHAALARQVLNRRRHDLGGIELSSGTGGLPKRRILSEEDVALDAAHVTRLLQVAGVRPDDRVTAVELTVTPLAVAFLEGCERLGVRDSTASAWKPGSDPALLQRLAPSVLIAPPSLLERLPPSWPGLRLVIYNGDRLGRETADRLRDRGVGVRSLYGLTETSALGVSCAEAEGIHLAPEHALCELLPLERDHELVVTTLGFSMPLLRYPTGDRVRPLRGRCRCGLPWPRVEILKRIGARFAIFEIETSVDELRRLLLGEQADTPLQVLLDDAPDGRVRLTLRLPAPLSVRRRELRARLSAHPLLDHLLATRLLVVRFGELKPGNGRKPVTLIDRRRRSRGHGG